MGSNDVTIVNEKTVACDGGDGSQGHPRVFLTLKDGKIVCPYCSKAFVKKEVELSKMKNK